MTRRLTLWLAVVALALVADHSVGRAAAGQNGPPYARDMTWTYRHTITRTGGQPRIGEATNIYRGTMMLQGKTYHVVDQSSTLTPGLVERAYLIWMGAYFRQAASVSTDARKNALAIIFDRPFGVGTEDRASGVARIVQNNQQRGTIAWTYSSVSRGTVTITVPAGTFETKKWETTLKLGKGATVYDIYVVGVTDIRVDAKEYLNGQQTSTSSRELVRGPVR